MGLIFPSVVAVVVMIVMVMTHEMGRGFIVVVVVWGLLGFCFRFSRALGSFCPVSTAGRMPRTPSAASGWNSGLQLTAPSD